MVAIGIENKWTRGIWGIDLRKNNGVAISVLHYSITNLFADFSANLEAFFGVMRYVSIVYPHRAKALYTKRLLLYVCLVFIVVLVPKNVFLGFASNPPLKTTNWYNIAIYVNFVTRSAIQTPVVFLCTIRIGIALWTSDSQRSKMMVSQNKAADSHSQSSQQSSKSRSLTVMLVLMSLSMLFTYVPYWVCHTNLTIMHSYREIKTIRYQHMYSMNIKHMCCTCRCRVQLILSVKLLN